MLESIIWGGIILVGTVVYGVLNGGYKEVSSKTSNKDSKAWDYKRKTIRCIELDKIFNTFYSLQESYKNYICLTESVHKQFHAIYGYGNNTEEQWNEFVNKYYKQ